MEGERIMAVEYRRCFNLSGNLNTQNSGGHSNGTLARSNGNHNPTSNDLPGYTNGTLAFLDGDFQSFDYASYSGSSSSSCSSSTSSSGSVSVVA